MERDLEIKARLVQTYDAEASGRDARAIRDWECAERDDFIARLQTEGRLRLVELGAGPGREGAAFQAAGLQAVSLDLSPAMVRLCHAKGLSCAVADFYALPFPDETFDAAWALNCLLHVPKAHLVAVLGEVARTLCPSALFYLGLYRGDHDGYRERDVLVPPRYFAFYQAEELRRLVEQVFVIERLTEREIGNDNGHFSLLLRKV
jgi:SAM-dependent methyltransferase